MQENGLETRKGVAVFEYDFAKHGGAIGAITIDPKLLPKDAIVTSGVIHGKIACVGATATLAFHLVGAADVLAATAVASFSANALIDVVPVGTAATMIRCTAATQLILTVAVAALTAGKIAVALEYVVTV